MTRYGPQGVEVEDLIKKVKTITPEQAKAFAAVRTTTWKADE